MHTLLIFCRNYRSKFRNEETIMFCLRVMVGVIILYDHVHPIGAFNKTTTIDASTIFFALWYERCHLWISEKLNHWNIATSWQTGVEEVQGDVVVVFIPCAQTVLPLTAFWFYIVKWKLPFVTSSPKNRDSEVVSFYNCHMFESGLWHPRVYCERGFDFI